MTAATSERLSLPMGILIMVTDAADADVGSDDTVQLDASALPTLVSVPGP